MAGRLWIDEDAADGGVLAVVARRLSLPIAGRDGWPEAGDAVIGFRRGRREREPAEKGYAPGVWLLDGRPGLDRGDIAQMLMAGVRVDPALDGELSVVSGLDRHAPSSDVARKVVAERPSEPVRKAVAERPSEPVRKAVAERPSEPVRKAVAERPYELVRNVVPERPFGPARKAVAERAYESARKAVAERPSEPVRKAVAERAYESARKAVVERPYEPVRKAVAERAYESARKAVAERPYEPVRNVVPERPSPCAPLIASPGRSGSAPSNVPAFRLFEVPVFHLRALTVRRIGQGAGLLPADWDGPHPLRRRLETAAVRALYATGRDFGTVTLAASDDGAVRVAGPFGEPEERDLPLWLEAVGAFRSELAEEAETGRRRELLIGADPEFLLVAPDGRVVSASRFFPRDGAAGSDALRVRGQLRCPVAELRPDPASDPDGLMRGIRGLMRRAELLAAPDGRPLRWLAGGMPVPGFALGGHIHLNVPPNARLLRVLDSCVALPLAAAEDERGVRRRPRYGALGDFRVKRHGFEYRTPPSWLVSPLAAQAAFAAALLAARHTSEIALLTGLPSETEAGRRAYYEGDRDTLRAMALRVHDAMRRVPGYAMYRRWLAPFFAAVERGAVWREDADIRPKWGLPARENAAGGDAHVDGTAGTAGLGASPASLRSV